MIQILKCEKLKYRHTSIHRMSLLTATASGLMGLLLMGVNWGQFLAWNMWYTLFGPFYIGYLSSAMISKDQNHLFHGMLGIFEDKKQLWIAKCFYGIELLLKANIFMGIFGILFYLLNGSVGIRIVQNVLAMLVLTICNAWQVPLFMFIARKTNFVVTTFICTVINIVCSIAFSLKLWWIPFAIPARLMCPILGMYPNGITIETDSIYLQGNLILPGLAICVVLFVITLLFTAKWFENAQCE